MAMNRQQEISEQYISVRARIAAAAIKAGRDLADLHLIAVTKNFPISDVEILKELGINDFGENRDAEGALKGAEIEATWHFQGQIQSNKLKSICTWSHVIHSLDDARHFELIEKFATHRLGIFLQVNLDGELHRGGIGVEDIYRLAEIVQQSQSHTLMGLMAVAPLTTSPEVAFNQLHEIQSRFLERFPAATALSAGMSGDFETAIEYGATHLRIGSQILGSRQVGG